MASTFGERLKSARIAKQLTQKQLAFIIDAKHNSISGWENDKNKPDPDTIELLCGVLDISPNYLLGITSNDVYSPEEKELIKKFRMLDPLSKEIVNFVIEKESERKKAQEKESKRNNPPEEIPDLVYDDYELPNTIQKAAQKPVPYTKE